MTDNQARTLKPGDKTKITRTGSSHFGSVKVVSHIANTSFTSSYFDSSRVVVEMDDGTSFYASSVDRVSDT